MCKGACEHTCEAAFNELVRIATRVFISQTITNGIRVGGGKHWISPILEQILMLWHKIRCFAEKIIHFNEICPSYLAIENFSSTIKNVIFKSVQHPMLWDVNPEVLMALARPA